MEFSAGKSAQMLLIIILTSPSTGYAIRSLRICTGDFEDGPDLSNGRRTEWNENTKLNRRLGRHQTIKTKPLKRKKKKGNSELGKDLLSALLKDLYLRQLFHQAKINLKAENTKTEMGFISCCTIQSSIADNLWVFSGLVQ